MYYKSGSYQFCLLVSSKFVPHYSKNSNASYFHIFEGSPSAGVFSNQVGKAIAYLASDLFL